MDGRQILCVDDEPANLAILRQVLKDDARLVFARGGEEALTAVIKHRPALILLDVDMPGLDGYEVCRRLKGDPLTKAIPVIFVTARLDEHHEIAGFEAGGADYIFKPFSALVVRARVRLHLSLVNAKQLESSYRAAVHMLGAAGHFNDTDTGQHTWRMASYTRALAEACGWAEERCDLIELAAALHDTGKIGIPDAILKKPGRLDATELAIMRTHSRIGYDILIRGGAPIFDLAAEISLNHHENWDGSGYPQGLAGNDIPESARIAAVADMFDALTVKRSYKVAFDTETVWQMIEESSGRKLDPSMVARYLNMRGRILDLVARWQPEQPMPHSPD